GPAVAHIGAWPHASIGGALMVALLASSLIGAVGALAYRVLPARLSRLERTAALPEDFAGLRRDLRDRLYSGVTGKSDLVKRIFEKMLVPYLRQPLGWVALMASGRALGEEQRRLRARIDRALEGRGAERLGGLDALIALVVELRRWARSAPSRTCS